MAVSEMCLKHSAYLQNHGAVSTYGPMEIVFLEEFNVFPAVRINEDIFNMDIVAWNDDFTKIVLSHFPYTSGIKIYFGLELTEDSQEAKTAVSGQTDAEIIASLLR